MINSKLSNLFWIESMFSWTKIILSGECIFFSVSSCFLSRVLFGKSEDCDASCYLNSSMQSMQTYFFVIALDRSIAVSKPIVWSPEIEDPLKRNYFSKKFLTFFIKFWPGDDFPIPNKQIPSFHKSFVIICWWLIN